MYLKHFFLSIFLIPTFLFAETEPQKTVNAYMDRVMQTQNVSGAAVAVIYVNKTYLYNFGFADKETKKKITSDTIFDIASVTKVFTTTALAIEISQKNMQLTDPVTDYFPRLKYLVQPVNQIKLVNLATHTASLPRESIPKDQMILFLSKWIPEEPIGSKYGYSNLGFGVLGEAISNKAGLDYEQMIQKLITAPLKMNSTFVHVPDVLQENYAQGYDKDGAIHVKHTYDILPGGGGLKSTARDMLKFLAANLGLAGNPLLSQAMFFTQRSYFRVNYQMTMGLGWQRFTTKDGLLIIDKNGGLPGFSSYIGFIPDKKIGIVILINQAKMNATRVGRSILIALENDEPNVDTRIKNMEKGVLR